MSELSTSPTPFTVEPLSGVRIYGRALVLDQKEQLHFAKRIIEDLASSQIHLLRHFDEISTEYKTYLFKEIQSFNEYTFEDEKLSVHKEEITEELIEQALSTHGSKFLVTDVSTSPLVLLSAITRHVIHEAALGRVIVHEGIFGPKIVSQVDFEIHLGSNTVIPIATLSEEQRQRVIKKSRGLIRGDEQTINTISGISPTKTKTVAFVIEEIAGEVQIVSAYPGPLAPAFPSEQQSREEQEYNQQWWDQHVMIVHPSNGNG